MRVIVLRLLAYMTNKNDAPAGVRLHFADMIFKGTRALPHLVRDQTAAGEEANVNRAIGQALDELAEEWGLDLEVEPIPQAPDPPGSFADNGLVELEALDGHGTFLAMERSFAVGVGNTIRLFEISTDGATDVSGLDVLGAPGAYEPVSKRLVADLETDLGLDPDNVEGMRFGPMLPDGRHLLILVSDNNFNPAQTTQIIALAVTLQPAGD